MEADHESRIYSTPDGKYLLISAFKWNTVTIVEAATHQIIKTLAVEAEPMNLAFPPDDSTMAFVANHGAGRVSRIDLESMTVAETFSSTPSPRKGRPEHLAFYRIEE